MVLGKLPVPGRPTSWIIVGQGPIALAVGAGRGLFGHFYSSLSFSSLSPSLRVTARYRLKDCLKGPLNPNQPQHIQNKVHMGGNEWYYMFFMRFISFLKFKKYKSKKPT